MHLRAIMNARAHSSAAVTLLVAAVSALALVGCARGPEGAAALPTAPLGIIDGAHSEPRWPGAHGGDVAGGTADAGVADVRDDGGPADPVVQDAGTGDVSDGGCVMLESRPAHQSTHHVDAGADVEYIHNPPTSGDHWPYWGRWMDHQHEDVPREIYVHNLEHGGIAVVVGPSTTPALEEQLRAAYEAIPLDDACVDAGHPHQRALLVYDGELDDAVAVVAWDDLLEGECVNAAQLAEFVARRRNHGPEHECGDGQW